MPHVPRMLSGDSKHQLLPLSPTGRMPGASEISFFSVAPLLPFSHCLVNVEKIYIFVFRTLVCTEHVPRYLISSKALALWINIYPVPSALYYGFFLDPREF